MYISGCQLEDFVVRIVINFANLCQMVEMCKSGPYYSFLPMVRQICKIEAAFDKAEVRVANVVADHDDLLTQ